MEKLEKPLDQAAMKAWSREVFGNLHRLSVAVAVATLEPERIYPEAIKDHLGLSDSTKAKNELERFVSAGLLESPTTVIRPRPGRPANVYRVVEDEFWSCLVELAKRRFST